MEETSMDQIQMDIICHLVQRHMDLLAKKIFSYLDETSLRNCESVSKCWYFVIRNCKVWKHLFHKVSMKNPLLKTLLLCLEIENKDEMHDDEFKFKKVFSAPKQICKNWSSGKYKTSTTNLGQMKVSAFAMDTRRLIFGLNSSDPPSIMVWNRWTLESEMVLAGAIQAHILSLILYEELIFSKHVDGQIVVWDLNSKRAIMQIQEDVPETIFWVDFHVAHGQLVLCYHLIDYEVGYEDTYITIRRICNPLTKMNVAVTERTPNVVIDIDSDNKFFVVFLQSEFVKFQLRSPSNFQIIQEMNNINLTERFAYNSGRLVTLGLDHRLEEMQLKVWDPETLTVKQSWPITQNCGVQELYLTSNHIILWASVDDIAKLIVWDLPSASDDISNTQPPGNGLFTCVFNSKEIDAMKNSNFDFAFDALEILTVSSNNVSPTSWESSLTRRDFATRN